MNEAQEGGHQVSSLELWEGVAVRTCCKGTKHREGTGWRLATRQEGNALDRDDAKVPKRGVDVEDAGT